MDYLNELSEEEKDLLYKAPVIFAALAAVSSDGKITPKERAKAVKLAHLRTYTSPPFLHDYYQRVDSLFEAEFEKIEAALPADENTQKAVLQEKMNEIRPILEKLDKDYSIHLTQSLKSFSRHIFNSDSHFLEYFILPVIMNELEKSFTTTIGRKTE